MFLIAVIIVAVIVFILDIGGIVFLGTISKRQDSSGLGPKASAEAFNQQGLDRLGQGNYEAAIESFSSAVVKSSHNTQYLQNLAVAQYNAHDLVGAEKTYEEILRIDEENAPAENGLANVLRDAKRPDDALLHYERAVRFDPSFLVAYVNRAYVLRDLGMLDEAKAVLREGKVKSGESTYFDNLLLAF